MKIAYFTPLPPIRSGISDYSVDLLPHLQQYADIDVFIDDYVPLEVLHDRFRIYSSREFERLEQTAGYDSIVYHMGNNPYHFYMYPFLRDYPGITVLHDFVLHHAIGAMTWLAGNLKGYAEELEYNYGDLGKKLFYLFTRNVSTDLEKFLFPLNKRIIDNSLGIIVHNIYAKHEIEDMSPDIPVTKINMGIPRIEMRREDRFAARKKLDIPTDNFVIGAFGFVTPIKNVDLVVQALHLIKKEITRVTLVIVGDVQDERVRRLVDDLDLSDSVKICGFVPESDFHDYIVASDVAVNLRYPTAGETSASLLRIMGMGVPVIIFNYRQFAETPDECCIKIDLGENEVHDIHRALRELAIDESRRRSIGERARQYIESSCTLEGAAREYFEFIDEIAKEKRFMARVQYKMMREKLLNSAAQTLAEIGIDRHDGASFAEFKKRLHELI